MESTSVSSLGFDETKDDPIGINFSASNRKKGISKQFVQKKKISGKLGTIAKLEAKEEVREENEGK